MIVENFEEMEQKIVIYRYEDFRSPGEKYIESLWAEKIKTEIDNEWETEDWYVHQIIRPYPKRGADGGGDYLVVYRKD